MLGNSLRWQAQSYPKAVHDWWMTNTQTVHAPHEMLVATELGEVTEGWEWGWERCQGEEKCEPDL